jgi:hypothetical protein
MTYLEKIAVPTLAMSRGERFGFKYWSQDAAESAEKTADC